MAARPVTWLRGGGLDYRSAPDRWRGQIDSTLSALLRRAAVSHLDRERGEPLRIRVHDPQHERERHRHLGPAERMQLAEDDYYSRTRPPGEIRIRPAGPILRVS